MQFGPTLSQSEKDTGTETNIDVQHEGVNKMKERERERKKERKKDRQTERKKERKKEGRKERRKR